MVTFRDSIISLNLEGGLLETLAIFDFIVDPSNPQDRKTVFEFGKEMKFNSRQKERKITRDKTLLSLLKPPAIMAGSLK